MIPEYLFKQAEREANAAMMKELYTEANMEPAVAGMDPEEIDPEVAAAINNILMQLGNNQEEVPEDDSESFETGEADENDDNHTVEKASSLRNCIFKVAGDASIEDLKNFINGFSNNQSEIKPSEPLQLTDRDFYRNDMLDSLSANPTPDDNAIDIVNRVNSIYKNPSYASTGLNDPSPLFLGKERHLADTLNEANDYISNNPQSNSGGIFENIAKKINSSLFGESDQAAARVGINHLLDRNRQRREKYLTEPASNIIANK